MKIVMISDTHFRRPGERLPRVVEEATAAADLIVYCGDSESLSAHEYLKHIGWVVAVRGNNGRAGGEGGSAGDGHL